MTDQYPVQTCLQRINKTTSAEWPFCPQTRETKTHLACIYPQYPKNIDRHAQWHITRCASWSRCSLQSDYETGGTARRDSHGQHGSATKSRVCLLHEGIGTPPGPPRKPRWHDLYRSPASWPGTRGLLIFTQNSILWITNIQATIEITFYLNYISYIIFDFLVIFIQKDINYF